MADVTGRGSYIVCQALTFAAAAIMHLPQEYQALNDRKDMLALLRARTPEAQQYLDAAAEAMVHLEDTRRGADVPLPRRIEPTTVRVTGASVPTVG